MTTRITDEQIREVKAMFNNGKDPKYIAERLNLKLNAVMYQISKMPKTGSDQTEEAEEEIETEDYKGWAEFWKDRYLSAHAQLIEADIID